LVFNYAVIVAKMHQREHVSGKYYFLGELILLFWFGAVLERVSVLSTRARRIVSTLGLTACASSFLWWFGFLNHKHNVSSLELLVTESRSSTLDELYRYISASKIDPERILASDWKLEQPDTDLRLKCRPFPSLNTLRNENAALVVMPDNPIPTTELKCLKLVHEIHPTHSQKKYFTYWSAVLGYRRTVASLRGQDEVTKGTVRAGPNIFIYNTNGCLS